MAGMTVYINSLYKSSQFILYRIKYLLYHKELIYYDHEFTYVMPNLFRHLQG